MSSESLKFFGTEPVTDFLQPADFQVLDAIEKLITSPNYPCGPAVASLQKDQYMIGVYKGFGLDQQTSSLYKDLLYFSQCQKISQAPFMSFWAVFDQSVCEESEFEDLLWKELSFLSSEEESSVPWDPKFSSDPNDKNFCLSLGGDAFFVVGLHPESSRLARKFPWPALVFNLYEQFEELSRKGIYENIVKQNRNKEMKFQGSLNPMVELHGDQWEAIQFSGQNNPATWKCPFSRRENK
jgi:FPC/CPF motif-containing protein YcgG